MTTTMNPQEIEDNREWSKIYLQQFVDNLKGNTFIEAVENLIKQFNSELSKEIEDHIEAENEFQQPLHLDTDYWEDKLLALTEMNIVYAYKEFEVNLKRLIKMTYKIDTRDLFRWQSIEVFLKSKGIKLSTLKSFKEVNEIRLVNNSIKHSNKIENELKKIAEFKSREYMDYNSLYKFYHRVKNHPYIFLEDLSTHIYDNLYNFDEKRLDFIANLYAERMDKESAIKFMELLKTKY